MIFTSSSTALSYVEQAEDIVFEKDAKKPVFCTGPQTSQTLKENDMEVTVEAIHPSIDGLIEALLVYFTDSHEA